MRKCKARDDEVVKAVEEMKQCKGAKEDGVFTASRIKEV